MRKLSILAVALGALACSACRCSAERASVERLGDQQEKLFVKYEAYVSADPKLNAAGKNDEFGLIKSLRDMMTSLKKAMGD